ncbi:MBL fold metallo-hydrolase [Glaciecola petra]|uniref:MBL fold metallo-hydrolase n=1 Tax=Glaciecola petra TaxID=3075602 RepID=A0ABU2ZUG0_9ALTE|nr:MBL fold metallo-hydrolase [Aestuariibacter sp. P117]MDT0596266.1 MBL fold metallo-hydrolase [Aestuariibacter sp. P117]
MISIKTFFHQASSTISYVVYDAQTLDAMIIDSALDYTAHSGKLWTEFADQQIDFIKENKLNIQWILETHAHADHISAAHYLRAKLKGKIAAGSGIKKVQKTFIEFFNLSTDETTGPEPHFDKLFEDGDSFMLGSYKVSVLSTPGHTNDSVTYFVDDNAFVGDTLFMPDGGTARCDFPGGSASVLFESIKRLHDLPRQTKLWMCHDYQPAGRELKYQCTVEQSRAHNIHVNKNVSCDDFVRLRESRDKTLDVPRLLYPAVQLNISAGRLPKKEGKGRRYIKQPLFFVGEIL